MVVDEWISSHLICLLYPLCWLHHNICHPLEAVNCFDNEAYDKKKYLKTMYTLDFMQKRCPHSQGPSLGCI